MKPRTINAKDGQIIEIRHGGVVVLRVMATTDTYGDPDVLISINY